LKTQQDSVTFTSAKTLSKLINQRTLRISYKFSYLRNSRVIESKLFCIVNTDVRILHIIFLSTRKYISIVSTWTSVYHKPFNVNYHLKCFV